MSKFMQGMSYIPKSFNVFIKNPSMRIYPIIPILVTFVVFVFGIYFGFGFLNDLFNEHTSLEENASWWAMVLSVIWTVVLLGTLFISSGYLFVMVTKIFAAPFNDLLSEKVELIYNPDYAEPEHPFQHFIATIYPTVMEEIKKVSLILLGYMIVFLTFIIPGINIISPILYVLYSILVISIDFVDYPLARRFYTIEQKKTFIKENSLQLYGLGTALFLLFMVPFMQLFIIPIAVVSGTLLFIDITQNEYAKKLKQA